MPCACVCTCGKEEVFSLFIEFDTCYIDCEINVCVYQQNPQQFDLVVVQWENNATGSHINWSSSTQTQSWLWVWRWMMALKNYWMWLSKMLLITSLCFACHSSWNTIYVEESRFFFFFFLKQKQHLRWRPHLSMCRSVCDQVSLINQSVRFTWNSVQ